jgi:hypothetical protein
LIELGSQQKIGRLKILAASLISLAEFMSARKCTELGKLAVSFSSAVVAAIAQGDLMKRNR